MDIVFPPSFVEEVESKLIPKLKAEFEGKQFRDFGLVDNIRIVNNNDILNIVADGATMAPQPSGSQRRSYVFAHSVRNLHPSKWGIMLRKLEADFRQWFSGSKQAAKEVPFHEIPTVPEWLTKMYIEASVKAMLYYRAGPARKYTKVPFDPFVVGSIPIGELDDIRKPEPELGGIVDWEGGGFENIVRNTVQGLRFVRLEGKTLYYDGVALTDQNAAAQAYQEEYENIVGIIERMKQYTQGGQRQGMEIVFPDQDKEKALNQLAEKLNAEYSGHWYDHIDPVLVTKVEFHPGRYQWGMVVTVSKTTDGFVEGKNLIPFQSASWCERAPIETVIEMMEESFRNFMGPVLPGPSKGI